MSGEGASAPTSTAFELAFRTRFDEAAPDGLIRTSNILRYAQDLAWLHSEAKGFDRRWYDEHQLTWLVRAAELAILAPIRVGTSLTGSTRVVGFRRVWSRRRSEFRDADGVLAAWIHIDWVLVDARGAPTRIPAVFGDVFGVPEDPLTLGRVTLGEAPSDAARSRFVVRPQELDPMDHVNNAVYADWLDEAIIAAGDTDATRAIPRTVALEYALAAAPGVAVESVAWRIEDDWVARVADAAGSDLLRASLKSSPMSSVLEG